MSAVVPTLNHNSVVVSIGAFDKSKSEKCLILLSGLLVPAAGQKQGLEHRNDRKIRPLCSARLLSC
jgi:hypothetical protein